MSRLETPSAIDQTPAASHAMLEAVKKQLGSVPNLFRLMAQSPATLEGYLGLSGALGKGALDAQTRTRIAMAVAEQNACEYCLSAHTYIGKNMAKLSDSELTDNRVGKSGDAKAAAALQFSNRVVATKGLVSDADLKQVKSAGYSDAQIIEMVGHVALNTFTNFLNGVAQTSVDFPVVSPTRR
jgi:uncharacterized peroxidase-related enzyme